MIYVKKIELKKHCHYVKVQVSAIERSIYTSVVIHKNYVKPDAWDRLLHQLQLLPETLMADHLHLCRYKCITQI